MKVTFILRNLTPEFYDGGILCEGLNNMSDQGKFQYLMKNAFGDMRHCITAKIGKGSFADIVELNALIRSDVDFDFKLEPRVGYKLATFNIEKR